MSERASTRELLQQTALRLFERDGFTEVSVAAVAKEAGVSHMTFFRHFPTKESVVTDDIFDPVLAAAVAAQPMDRPPLERAVRGFVAALDGAEARAELNSQEFRRRVALAASVPALRPAVWAAGRETEVAIARALVVPCVPDADADEPGLPDVEELAARAAAAAVMGAATAVLMSWVSDSSGEGRSPSPVVGGTRSERGGGVPATDPATVLRIGLLTLLRDAT